MYSKGAVQKGPELLNLYNWSTSTFGIVYETKKARLHGRFACGQVSQVIEKLGIQRPDFGRREEDARARGEAGHADDAAKRLLASEVCRWA